MSGEQRAKEACHDESRSFPCRSDRGSGPAAGCLRGRWPRAGLALFESRARVVEGAVPTAEQLASALVTADDYDGKWAVNVPPDPQMAIPGVVPDKKQQLLPKIEFCDKASEESRSATAALRWQAFRQLDQSDQGC